MIVPLARPCGSHSLRLKLPCSFICSHSSSWLSAPGNFHYTVKLLLCLSPAFRMLIDRSQRWQYFFISGFVLGSGFMFMENFVCLLEYGDIYTLLDNRTYVIEMTDPMFGGIAGIGLLLILKGRWLMSSLFILPPILLHFCHNVGVIVLGGVPWWPLYFLSYISVLLAFAWEYLCTSSETESPTGKPILAGNGRLRFLRRP